MTASLMMTTSWDIAPCSLVEVDHRDDGGSSTSLKLSVYFSRTTRCHIPEGSHLHIKIGLQQEF
jgi:hypothetical protein